MDHVDLNSTYWDALAAEAETDEFLDSVESTAVTYYGDEAQQATREFLEQVVGLSGLNEVYGNLEGETNSEGELSTPEYKNRQ